MDKYDESIFAASELLKLGSNQATAHRLLGDSYIMIDKYADAEAEFLKAQQIDKSDYTIMARLVDARYLQGKFDQALTMARNLHEAHPDYGPVLSSLCRCLETDVENKMSSKDNAGYFTNMKQIQHAELVVSEMRALGNIDKADEEWIEKMEGLIDWARKRHYIAPARWFWILCGLTFLFMISGSSGALLTLVLFFGLLLYAFFFVVPTGWMINARKLGELAKRTGLQ